MKVQATPTTIEQIAKLQGVHKGLIMGEPEDLDRMQAELTAKYPDLTFVRSSKILLEIVLKGVINNTSACRNNRTTYIYRSIYFIFYLIKAV